MKILRLLLIALFFCTTAVAQSPAGTKPLPKEEKQVKDSIIAGGLDAYLNGLEDDDGDDVLNRDDVCPKEKGTAKNKGCPEADVGKDEVPFTLKEKKVKLKDAYADEKSSADIEENLIMIFADAKNDFEKYIGESYGAETFGVQSFEYGLTLGGEEKIYKYYDTHVHFGFNARFKTEEQLAKAVTIKAALESLTKEMVNKYNYTQKQIGDLITIKNTDALFVYDYKVVNNKLTELNIYSSGAAQLARNKEVKTTKTETNGLYKTVRATALTGLKLTYTFMLNSIGEKYNYEFIGGDAIDVVNFKWGANLNNEFSINWDVVENATKYVDFFKIITTKTKRTLDKDCAIILSDINFKEITSKGETKMDFGNGLETFKFFGDGKINSLYIGRFKEKKEIVLTNDSKTIFLAVLDYKIFPLITKIKTPTQLLDLSLISYK